MQLNIFGGKNNYVMSMQIPSTAVVNSNVTQPTSRPTNTASGSNNNLGLIFGVCLGGFGWYVSTVSNIAVHFYWVFPVITAGIYTVHVSRL